MTGGVKNMRSLLSTFALAIALCCSSAQAQTAAPKAAHPTGPGSLNGLWTTLGYKGSQRYSPRERVARTVDGKWPPLLPAPAELLEQRIKMSERGEPFVNTIMECLPGGVPEMVLGSPYPTQFIEMPGQITILYEMYNHFRIIYMNGKHPEDPDPTYMGHSIGRWEGDTLVVDTIGLTDRTTIDEVGMPHSEDLRVTERYRRVDNNTLEIIVTINDPKTFSQPWDTKAIYKAAAPGAKMIEFICENNRSNE